MRWIGTGVLRWEEGFINYGEEIPAGVLTPEREAYLLAKGRITAGDAKPAAPSPPPKKGPVEDTVNKPAAKSEKKKPGPKPKKKGKGKK